MGAHGLVVRKEVKAEDIITRGYCHVIYVLYNILVMTH